MKLTLELLLLVFVITVFTPSLFYVCHATQADTVLEADIKAEKVPLKTHDNTVKEEEIAISDDGYSIADRALLREEDHKFQAEINQLMGIIINSLYSNRDIFLRELISNSHDALSKIRFLSLTNPGILGDTTDLDIRVKMDPQNGLLHIRDTGIGMTKDDLINNLGSIAKSGTKEFLEKISSSGSEMDYIGQFGVGFYSSFLVADRVTVTSKHNDDEQYIWEGSGENSSGYSIAKDPRGNTLGRGTLITLHLKEDAKKYLDHNTLKQLILRYNEFINYPIFLWTSKEVPVTETDKTEEPTDETVSVEEEEEEEEEKPAPKMETVWGWERINPNQPLWTRKKSEIKDEDYLAFYKDALKSSEDPLYFTHFKAEGEAEFTALLYIPSSLPFGYWEPGFESQLKLYVKRVFITDDFEEMMPSYLNFVKGVVDSDYFPLNVSREMLQQNKTLALIKKKLVRKVLAMFQEIADDKENPEKFEKFYKAFSTCLKLGIIHDSQNRTRISKLLRFFSAKKDQTISFEEYVADMKSGQEEIYYLGGESLSGIRQSPLLERILARGYDVLLLPEPVDEYAINTIGKYDGKFPFVDISKEGLKLSEEDEDKKKGNFGKIRGFDGLSERCSFGKSF